MTAINFCFEKDKGKLCRIPQTSCTYALKLGSISILFHFCCYFKERRKLDFISIEIWKFCRILECVEQDHQWLEGIPGILKTYWELSYKMAFQLQDAVFLLFTFCLSAECTMLLSFIFTFGWKIKHYFTAIHFPLPII